MYYPPSANNFRGDVRAMPTTMTDMATIGDIVVGCARPASLARSWAAPRPARPALGGCRPRGASARGSRCARRGRPGRAHRTGRR